MSGGGGSRAGYEGTRWKEVGGEPSAVEKRVMRGGENAIKYRGVNIGIVVFTETT